MTSQMEIEALFSQRNIHEVLHQSVLYQLDKALETWSIANYIRLNDYLNGTYYESKNKRIGLLREHIEDNGLDHLVVAFFVAAIRSKKNQTIQQVIGYLQSYMPHTDIFDRIKTAGEFIAVCSGPNRAFTIERFEDVDSPMLIVNNWPAINRLFKTEFEYIEETFFNPPLVEKPRQVVDRYNCGYHTIQEPILLGKYTQHDDQIDLNTINILNNIPWVLDPDITSQIERPSKPFKDDQTEMNFIVHVGIARRIYKLLSNLPFFFSWQYDSRGRMYSHGYHVNLQSYEYKKVMLNHDYSAILTT